MQVLNGHRIVEDDQIAARAINISFGGRPADD